MFTKSYMAFAAMLISAATSTTALANTKSLMQDITKAAQVEGVAPATGQLPVIKSGQLIASATDGVQLAVADTGKIISTGSGSIVKDDDSSVVFQKINANNFRASIHITSPAAPERYEFTVLGAAELKQQFDGSVIAIDATGRKVATIAAPWARDKNGTIVPTHYEIDSKQRNKLVQVVSHTSGEFEYDIVADPKWLKDLAKIGACVGIIGVTIAGNAILISKIAKLGGAYKVAKILVKSATAQQRWTAAKNFFGEISGLSGIILACT